VWSTITELYPVHVSMLPPLGQAAVVEPQTEGKSDPERMRVTHVTGIIAYKQHGPLSTLHWVAKC